MKVNRIVVVIVVAIVALLAIAVMSVEWQKIEQELGLSEQGIREPLLVAKTLLEQQDKELIELTQSKSFYQNNRIILDTQTSLIIDEAALTEHEALDQASLNWVGQGGHLLYLLSPRRESANVTDNAILATASPMKVTDSNNPIYYLNVKNSPDINVTINAMVLGERFDLQVALPHRQHFAFCPGTTIENHYPISTKVKQSKLEQRLSQQFEELMPEQHQNDTVQAADFLPIPLICEIGYGNGTITFITSIQSIANHGIRHHDNAAFLYFLIGDNHTLAYLPSLDAPNWLQQLWQWSWLAVVLTLFGAIALLWHMLVRIGLPYTPVAEQRSSFSEHIRAMGHFLHRHQHDSAIHQALLQDIEQHINKKNPAFNLLNDQQKAEQLSDISGFKSDTILKLLREPLSDNISERLAQIQQLQQLRRAL